MREILHVGTAPPEDQAVQCGRIVGAEPREERHVVGAGEHVHGVDLDDAEPAHHRLQVSRARGGRLLGAREALSRQRHPPGLSLR